jgi:nitrite reductase (NADH) large subunit
MTEAAEQLTYPAVMVFAEAPGSAGTTFVSITSRRADIHVDLRGTMAAVGCPRNCAEATVKDIGLVGQDGSWQVVVGGAAGKSVRKADLLITVESTEAALEAAELFFQYYRENGNYLERTYDFVVRVGMEKIRKETVYAVDTGRGALLDRFRKSKARSYDAWQEGRAPRNRTQFIPLEPIDQVTA